MTWHLQAIQRLEKATIRHRAFDDRVRHLTECLALRRGAEFFVVAGPTHVGKSKIVETSTNRLLKGMRVGPADIPIVKIVTDNSSTNGFFSTKAFMVSACRAVRHPFFDGKSGQDWGPPLDAPRPPSESMLREAFLYGLRKRNAAVLVVDELQQVLHCKGGWNAALRVLDSFKGLALNAGIPLVMAGSYVLLQMVRELPHLVSRSTCVHVEPYDVDDPGDLKVLFGAFRHLVAGCPLEGGDTALTELAELVIPRSVGSVGHMSRWVVKAIRQAKATESHLLGKSHFIASAFTLADSSGFREEIRKGRELFRPDNTGLGDPSPDPSQDRPQTANRRPRPFTAKPHRHPSSTKSNKGRTP